jgi:hypothetical protein|tara:strand:+ start:1137 stop:1310 length:174 start_codon:yes stop_codon:yes gene_type:complete
MESEELEKIKELIPFKEMNADEFKEIIAKATLSSVPKGTMIFKRADNWQHRSPGRKV